MFLFRTGTPIGREQPRPDENCFKCRGWRVGESELAAKMARCTLRRDYDLHYADAALCLLMHINGDTFVLIECLI